MQSNSFRGIRFITIVTIVGFISCNHNQRISKYYNKSKWQKFKKDYDQGYFRGRPLEAKQSFYTDLSDTTLQATGKANGYEAYKFNDEGDMVYWHLQSNDSQWVTSESKYDAEKGLQSRYYTHNDSLHTFEDGGKVISRRWDDTSFLLHSFMKIGAPYLHISFFDKGNKVVKRFLPDTIHIDKPDVVITSYYRDSLVTKIETETNKGWKQVETYYYSPENFLDSITKHVMYSTSYKEVFVNDKYGFPLTYAMLRLPNYDTVILVKNQYEYDAKGNWTKRLENKIKGNYGASGKNPHYTLTVQEFKYKD